MEKWQMDHVCTNLVNLHKFTDCNGILISSLRQSGILSEADIDLLNAEKKNGKFAQVALLYNIIQTRENGYEKLINALIESKKSGAYQILLDGLKTYGTQCSLQQCTIDIDPEDILNAEVDFQGKTTSLQDLWHEMNAEELKFIISTNLIDCSHIDQTITNGKRLLLVENTIPPAIPYYISRSISNKVTLDPAIFKEKCADVFVFKEIERVKLSILAKPNTTSTSTEQLVEFDSRFILLDYPVDWDELKAISKAPIHLVRVEKIKNTTTYHLDDSTGNSATLRKFVGDKKRNEKVYITEDEFLKTVSETKASGFCICDSPGMGKSVLLANLARKLSKAYPRKITAYIPLPQFVQKIKSSHPKNEVTKTEALNYVLEEITPSPFSKSILQHALDKGWTQIQIFFDGLDEVQIEDSKLAISLLKALSKDIDNIQLFVTSRPHKKRDLEETLRVIAYDILPLTQENQIEFLVTFWTKLIPKADKQKLQNFALACLKNLKITINKEKRDIVGIPLLCYLLAEVYTNEARLYANPERNQNKLLLKPITVYEMYNRFVTMRFSTVDRSESECSSWFSQIKNFHILNALHLIFPQHKSSYAHLESLIDVTTPTETYLKFGILETSNKENNSYLNFVHRTIAEYFVAEYFVDTILSLTEKDVRQFIHLLPFMIREGLSTESKELLVLDEPWGRPIFQIQLFRFTNPVILYFFNAHLSIRQSLEINQSVANAIVDASTNSFYKILQCSIIEGFPAVLYLLREVIRSADKLRFKIVYENLDEAMIPLYRYNTLNYNFHVTFTEKATCFLPIISAKFSSINVMKECLEIIQAIRNDTVIPIYEQTYRTKVSPIYMAAARGNFELVEFLMDKCTWETRDLLHVCVKKSYLDDSSTIKTKIEICKLLLETKPRSPTTIKQTNEELLESLILFKVHLEILKFLIQNGSNVSTSRGRKNIFHYAYEYMSNNDFHEYCRFLVEDCKDIGNIPKYPISPNIISCASVDEKTISLICSKPSFHVNGTVDCCNGEGNNCIQSAIRNGQSLKTIKALVDLGANVNFRNKLGKTVLHFAVAKDNKDLIIYFMSLGLDLEERDINENTPLLHASSLSMVKFLLKLKINIHATNKWGNTLVHILATKMSKKEFHNFVDFFLKFDKTSYMLSIKNTKGQTPLHIRLESYDEVLLETVKIILSVSGVEINSVDRFGNTYLLQATKSIEITKFILENGADILARDNFGNGVAHRAVLSHNSDVLLVLLEYSENTAIWKATNKHGLTPLHLFLKQPSRIGSKRIDVLEKLLRIYEELCITHEFSLLLCAMYCDFVNVKVLEMLRTHGVDFKVSDKKGQNALHLAMRQELPSVSLVSYLIKVGGVNPYQADKRRRTVFESQTRESPILILPHSLCLQSGLADNENNENQNYAQKGFFAQCVLFVQKFCCDLHFSLGTAAR